MKKRVVYIILGTIFLLAAIAVGGYTYSRTAYTPPALSEQIVRSERAEEPAAPTETPEPTVEPSEEPAPTATPEPYDSPIDFDALQEINSDIYAWLEIDGTNISYPIVQHPEDDDYYLTHNSDGNYSANGAIFTQPTYNSTDFEDPVTVIYGHRMGSAMFGSLMSKFSNAEFFQEYNIIRVYTPERLLEYKVFAAVPYSNEHILYEHDFSEKAEYNAFFRGVYSIRRLEAQFDQEGKPSFEDEDKVLILSTCLQSNRSMRFLVMAALQQ